MTEALTATGTEMLAPIGQVIETGIVAMGAEALEAASEVGMSLAQSAVDFALEVIGGA